jgi:hypothetical protein
MGTGKSIETFHKNIIEPKYLPRPHAQLDQRHGAAIFLVLAGCPNKNGERWGVCEYQLVCYLIAV